MCRVKTLRVCGVLWTSPRRGAVPQDVFAKHFRDGDLGISEQPQRVSADTESGLVDGGLPRNRRIIVSRRGFGPHRGLGVGDGG